MDVRIINPFLSAAIHVLRTMAGIEPKPGKPFFNREEYAAGVVTAMIPISGAACGSMALTFTESCIKAVVHNLLGEEITEIGPEVKDAVGELTNMICGDARRRLGEEGFSLQGGIPTVVAGVEHKVQHTNNAPRLAIPFETRYGRFIVEVVMSKQA